MEQKSDHKTTKQERSKLYEDKADERKHSSLHIAGFVLGLISLLANLFWYISLPTGILAIVFGAKSTKRTGSKLGKAGLILGIIGLSACTFVYVSIIFIAMLHYL